MSRSLRAWARSCELVGAAVRGARRLGKLEVRETLEAEPLVRSASSLTTLTWVATAVMLMLACSPALALGKSAGRGGRAPAAPGAQVVSHTPVTKSEHPSDPPHSSGSDARGRIGRIEVLAVDSGYANAHGASAVRALQRRLASLGYSPGPIDGRYGPLTEAAVLDFQATHGLLVDGIDGPLTMAALTSAKLVLRPGDGYGPGGSGLVRTLQRHLAGRGFSPGPIDGRYGPLTEQAVIRFQTAHHLQVDGVAGPQTLGHLRPAAQRQAPPRPRPRPSPRRTHRSPRPPRTRSTRVPVHSPGHQARRSTGFSLLPRLIVLAWLIAAMFAALLWHRRRSRDGWSKPAVAVPGGEAEDSTEDPGTIVDEPGPQGPSPPPGAGAFKLAEVLAEAGDFAGAANALRRADQHGHPTAAYELGVLLEQEGDRAGAIEAFRRGAQRGHADAAFNLGVLLLDAADQATTEAAFAQADQGGDPDAACNLGVLLEQRGDLTGARLAYQRADERGHAGAAFDLGVLLLNAGEKAGAEAAFARADERGNADAACNLGVLLEQRGDVIGARLAYERADSRGHAVGAWNLGSLLEQHDDRAGAKAAYQRAEQRGYAAGACNLGLMLKQEGDRAGALRAFERAGQTGPPEVAEMAYAAMQELRSDSNDER